MISSNLLWLIALITSHFAAYYMGTTHAATESYTPSDEAWVAVQCHAIDKSYEYARWSKEREEADTAAPSSD